MEGGERMDIIRKKRTDSSRKPRLGGSHTFMNEHDHSSASGSPPSDLQSAAGFDKVSNEDAGKHSNHNSSHVGDDYRRKFGNNNNKGKLETGKNDLGRSKNINRRAGGGAGDEDWDDMKRVWRDVAELNGNSKHRGMEDDRNYDRKHERGGGSKAQDYGRNKQVEKPSREKSYRNGSHYDKDSKENSMGEKGGERDRRFFGETFKRKMRADDLDRSTWSRDGGMERKQSYDRHVSHEKSVRDRDRDRERDRERDRDRERNHDGAPRGRSRDVQGNSKSGDGGHRAVVVGLSAVGGSLDCHNPDGHKVLDKRSSDAHTMSQAKGGSDSTHGAGHTGLQDGGRKADGHKVLDKRSSDTHTMSQAKGGSDSAHGAGHTGLQDGGRKADGHHMGKSKSENTDIKAPESLNVGQVKAGPDGKTYDIREPMDKPTHRQDDPHSKENRVTTVKLKVSGVTHTIHANLAPGNKQKGAEGPSASGRPPQAPEGGRRRQRLILQENSDDEDDYPPRVEKYLQGSLRKESPANCSSSATKMDVNRSKEDRRSKLADESTSGKWVEAGSQPVRKSSRIPKKRVLDGEIDDDEESEEATQRKSSRTPKKRMQNGEYDEDREEGETLKRKSSRMPKKRMLDGEYDEVDGEDGAQRQKKKQKKSRTGREPENMYGEYEEEVASDDGYFENSDMEHEGRKNSKRKEALNSTIDEKKEISLTARQRALQSCKDVDTEVGANLIEFPEGLPQTCQRKKKENLSEVEQQLKKAEAAQRRKQQVEKAANAQQAEAIKKILGTDSSRKKKEDKLRKQRDEKEQEKSASAMILAPNSVRWVMRPSGTVVSFAQDSGLPSIFNSAPCRYPPAREKCAGPLCNNSYKYRDSKSNLPLCSLQCYRAIHDATHPVSTC